MKLIPPIASCQFDLESEELSKCDLLLPSGGTLASTKLDPSSVVNLAKTGYNAYESTTTVNSTRDEAVRKDYIIDQLTQCGSMLDSLNAALKSVKNNQIAVDDPGALKVIATSNNIKELLDSFKNAIPEDQRKGITDELDAYIAVTLNRNNTVIDYNTSIQLLLKAEQSLEYSKSQADSMGQRKLELDPNTPAIVFWLHKTRDNIRLELMQRLNYESRAIRFWGLWKHLDYSTPGPLQSALQLRDGQLKLNDAFENSLQ